MESIYRTITICKDLNPNIFNELNFIMGRKLDMELEDINDYINRSLSPNEEVISHSLSFVGTRCILSILLKRNQK